MFQLIALALLALQWSNEAATQCNCGAEYFTDKACTNSIFAARYAYEFQDVCVSNTMPLGSRAYNTINNATSIPYGAYNASYKISKCTTPWDSKAILQGGDMAATLPLVTFTQYAGTSCTGKSLSQTFPPDMSCQMIWVFSDQLYVKYYCNFGLKSGVSPVALFLALFVISLVRALY